MRSIEIAGALAVITLAGGAMQPTFAADPIPIVAAENFYGDLAARSAATMSA